MTLEAEQVEAFINEALVDPTPLDDNVAGYLVGYRWRNSVTKTIWVCLDTTTGAAIWGLDATVPGVEAEHYKAIKTITQQFTSPWVDITWDTEILNTGSFALAGAQLTVTKDTVLRVSAKLSADQASGNNRSTWHARLLLDGSPVIGTQSPEYSRSNSRGDGTVTITTILSVTSGQVLKIQAERISGAGTLSTLECDWSLNEFKGPPGPKGDPGVGASIAVENDTTLLPNSPIGTLNFGSGVTATPDGAGRATVTATVAYLDDQESLGVSSHTSNSWTTKLTIVTPAVTGRFRIGWSCEHRFDGWGSTQDLRIRDTTNSVTLAEKNKWIRGGSNNLDQGWYIFSGFAYIDLVGAAVTIRLQHRVQDAGDSTRVRRARLELRR